MACLSSWSETQIVYRSPGNDNLRGLQSVSWPVNVLKHAHTPLSHGRVWCIPTLGKKKDDIHCEENSAVSWQMRRRRWMGTAQSEQIPTRIVLTALFPYVIRFSMEITSFVDGLCWMPYTDWQHHISHHLSLFCSSVQCTFLAGEVVPGSFLIVWFSAIFVSLLDSPAEECGLKPGDRILFLNGLDMRFVFSE